MTSTKKLITVFGATGQQGHSVTTSFLKNQVFTLRGISRNSESSRAKDLAALGVDIVAANGFDTAALESAFNGSWGIFVNTNSGDEELNRGAREFELGKNILDAAINAGVQHLVYSSASPTSELMGWKIKINSMDLKHDVEMYARTLPFKTVAFVQPGWYMENYQDEAMAQWGGGFPLIKDADGILNLKYPDLGGDRKLPYVAMQDDFGDLVQGLFLAPEKYNGRNIQAISSNITYDEVVHIYTEVTKNPARFTEIDVDEMPTYDMQDLIDLVLIYKYTKLNGGNYFGPPTELETARELKREVAKAVGKEATLLSWDKFVQKYFL